MSNLAKKSIPSKMDTKEIAGVTGKEHKHVLRDTRVMLVTLFAGEYVDRVIPADKASQRGQYIQDNVEALFKGAFRDGPVLDHEQNHGFTLHWDYRNYLASVDLNRNLTLTLASGYDIHLRNRIIARLEELEAQMLQPAVPRNFAQALRLAAEQQEEIERQQLALEQAKPKVVYADTMLNADGTVLVRDAAKIIGAPVRQLETALREKGVILPNNAPAAKYVSKGYFKESVHPYKTNTRGTQFGHVARATGRGLEFLRRFAMRHLTMPSASKPQEAAQ
ncbi:MAG: phage antirepressor KilAC domain-containing protein [Pseudomonadales bacterium]